MEAKFKTVNKYVPKDGDFITIEEYDKTTSIIFKRICKFKSFNETGVTLSNNLHVELSDLDLRCINFYFGLNEVEEIENHGNPDVFYIENDEIIRPSTTDEIALIIEKLSLRKNHFTCEYVNEYCDKITINLTDGAFVTAINNNSKSIFIFKESKDDENFECLLDYYNVAKYHACLNLNTKDLRFDGIIEYKDIRNSTEEEIHKLCFQLNQHNTGWDKKSKKIFRFKKQEIFENKSNNQVEKSEPPHYKDPNPYNNPFIITKRDPLTFQKMKEMERYAEERKFMFPGVNLTPTPEYRIMEEQ